MKQEMDEMQNIVNALTKRENERKIIAHEISLPDKSLFNGNLIPDFYIDIQQEIINELLRKLFFEFEYRLKLLFHQYTNETLTPENLHRVSVYRNQDGSEDYHFDNAHIFTVYPLDSCHDFRNEMNVYTVSAKMKIKQLWEPNKNGIGGTFIE